MAFESELFNVFIEETREQIETVEQDILKFEKDNSSEIIGEVLRIVHSIKGSTLSMGFNNLSEFVHNIENLLLRIKNNCISTTSEIINLLLECLDKIKEVIDSIERKENDVIDLSEIINKINSVVGTSYIKCSSNASEDNILNISENDAVTMEDAAKRGEKVYIVRVDIQEDCQMRATKAFLVINNMSDIGQVLRVSPENYNNALDQEFGYSFKFIIITSKPKEKVEKFIDAAAEIKRIVIEEYKGKDTENNNTIDLKIDNSVKDNRLFRGEKRSSIRVDISKLDRMMELFGELIIDKEQLQKVSDSLVKKYEKDKNVQELSSIVKHLQNLSSELQDSIISARVYTIENVCNRLSRMVRDLANRSGKQIDFIIEGQNIELDRRILEEIVDPLIHILRNSVDHGIERPDERLSKNKSATGKIELKVSQTESSVIFEVNDDGRGLDIEIIKGKAIEKNLVNSDDLAKMEKQNIINMIFLPGFSTARVVTEISGRGIGMDVVKTNIEKLNGTIDIETEKDLGCKFLIKLPLTLALIKALLIKQDDIKFAIPLCSLENDIVIDAEEFNRLVKKEHEKYYFMYKEHLVTVINLADYFKLNNFSNNRVHLIISRYFNKYVSFLANEILDEQQVIVKNVGENFNKLGAICSPKGVLNATVISDGSEAFLIDVLEMIKITNS